MQKGLINKTADFVKDRLTNEGSGHDWWHIWRVWQLAKKIGEKEKADMFIVELAVLLHDIADWKSNSGNENIGAEVSRKWLESISVEKRVIDSVSEIIATSSFKGSGTKSQMFTIEGKVVQDADRLDAIGAIGIARGFMFAGNKNLPMYDPDIKPQQNMQATQYKDLKRPSYTQINHFYEKLLLLKDLMNTDTARAIAERRHKYMEDYLDEFYAEWNGAK